MRIPTVVQNMDQVVVPGRRTFPIGVREVKVADIGWETAKRDIDMMDIAILTEDLPLVSDFFFLADAPIRGKTRIHEFDPVLRKSWLGLASSPVRLRCLLPDSGDLRGAIIAGLEAANVVIGASEHDEVLAMKGASWCTCCTCFRGDCCCGGCCCRSSPVV